MNKRINKLINKRMSKNILICSLILCMILLSACNKGSQGDKGDDKLTQTPTPTQTLGDSADISQKPDGSENNNQGEGNNTSKLADYYPMLADVEFIYTGEGNEYASFNRFTDYISEDGSRIQIRSNNGGTEIVEVIEVKDGKISVIKAVPECYYRDNFIVNAVTDENAEILLMEPLQKGTSWTLSDGRKRYISGIDIKLTTPTGDYQTIEVTTESDDSINKDYYAPRVGLVKTVFSSGDYEVVSELSQIKQDALYSRSIEIFYPGIDTNIHVFPVTLTYKTGDITRLLLQKEICKEVEKEDYLPLASTQTKINSMYLGSDGIAYIDFSKELVEEMQLGAGYEGLTLQSITNTVGTYYDTDKVYITVEGNPYESGHILMNKGELYKVDMSRVIRVIG